jgi:hypothetical protein
MRRACCRTHHECFHLLCTTTGRSLAVPMKMASPFSHFMPDQTTVIGGSNENGFPIFILYTCGLPASCPFFVFAGADHLSPTPCQHDPRRISGCCFQSGSQFRTAMTFPRCQMTERRGSNRGFENRSGLLNRTAIVNARAPRRPEVSSLSEIRYMPRHP